MGVKNAYEYRIFMKKHQHLIAFMSLKDNFSTFKVSTLKPNVWWLDEKIIRSKKI